MTTADVIVTLVGFVTIASTIVGVAWVMAQVIGQRITDLDAHLSARLASLETRVGALERERA